MKKYIVGAFFGFILAFTLSAHADVITSLVGKSVQGEFPVKIDGQTLDKPAIVIDGTSYLPNRAIAGALNMDISFNADLGIELKKKEVVPLTTTDATLSTSTPEPKYPTISRTDELKLIIDGEDGMLSHLQESLKNLQDYVNGGGKEDVSAKITEFQGKIVTLSAKLEKEKAELTTLTP